MRQGSELIGAFLYGCFYRGGFRARPAFRGGDILRIQTLNTIKHGGHYYKPGVELDVDDSAGRYFVEEGVAQAVALPGTENIDHMVEVADPIDDLCQVDGVGKKIAAALVAAGVASVEGLQDMTADQLAAIKGVSKARADQILADVAQFSDEDDFDEETALDEDDYLGE